MASRIATRAALQREPRYSNPEPETEDETMSDVKDRANVMLNKHLAAVFDAPETCIVADIIPDLVACSLAVATLEHADVVISDETWLKASQAMRATMAASFVARTMGGLS